MLKQDQRLPVSEEQSTAIDVFAFVAEIQRWAEAIDRDEWDSAERMLENATSEAACVALHDSFENEANTTPLSASLPPDAASVHRFLSIVTKLAKRSCR